MSALEQEIIEKFYQLPPAAKRRILTLIEQEIEAESGQETQAPFDYTAWVRDVEALRQQIRISQGGTLPPIDGVGMLRGIRDGIDE